MELEIAPLAFYQVNRQAAERLYAEAAEFAGLTGKETVYDLYCGTGVIGLSMAHRAERIIGVEVISSAVENAEKNARRNGIENAVFYTADVAKVVSQLAVEYPPDVVLLDPPRKGCDPVVVERIAQMNPSRIVMIACNPASAARDCARLAELGYTIDRIRPVDLFPRTGNVETVVLLSKGEVDSKKIRVEFSLEDMDMSEISGWGNLSADQGVCVGAYRVKGVQPLYLTD